MVHVSSRLFADPSARGSMIVATRSSQDSGMKATSPTAATISSVPRASFARLLNHRKSAIATIATTAPREWLPMADSADSAMAPTMPTRIQT